MKLSDFATLAEAQAYEEVTTKNITSDVMTMLLTQHNLLSYTLDGVDDRLRAFALRLSTDSLFNFKSDSTLGQANIASLDSLITNEVDPNNKANIEAFKASVIAMANVTTTPFAATTQAEFDFAQGEEVALTYGTGQQIIPFAITISAPKPTRVTIMQRYGNIGNLTPWHEVGATNVHYMQDGYKIQIRGVNAPVRELKAVCEYQLGMVFETSAEV